MLSVMITGCQASASTSEETEKEEAVAEDTSENGETSEEAYTEEDEPVSEKADSENDGGPFTSDTDEGGKETGSEGVSEPDETDGAALMNDFAEGRGTIVIPDTYMNCSNLINMDFGSLAEEMDLEGFLSVMGSDPELEEPLENFELKKISYGSIDVTDVPGDWYCMTMDISTDSDGTCYFIVQASDGELKLRCSGESVYRTSCFVNQYGVLTTGGSAGAGSYVEGMYVADGEGKYFEISYSDSCCPGWDFYEGDNSDLAINNVMHTILDNDQIADEQKSDFVVTQYLADGNYYYVPEITDEDELEYFNSLAYEAGAETYTTDEFSKVINALCESCGITLDQLNDETLFEVEYERNNN